MRLMSFGLLLLALAAPALSEPTQPDLKLLAARYVEAQEAVYKQGAGAPQLDALMGFYAPDYTYYHPQFGAKVTGLDNVRRGTGSHLGEAGDAAIIIKAIIVNGNMVALALEEDFGDPASAARIVRQRTTVLTFKGDKIVQRVDI